jgi:hypothetical protein
LRAHRGSVALVTIDIGVTMWRLASTPPALRPALSTVSPPCNATWP